MTTPQNSVMTTFGRIYATGEEGNAWLGKNAKKIENNQELAWEGIQKGLVKPSLTTILKHSRVLVLSNKKLTEEERDVQSQYLEITKATEKLLAKTSDWTSVSLKNAMATGTAVHYAAEVINETMASSENAYFNPEIVQHQAWRDLALSLHNEDREQFNSYVDALSLFRMDYPAILESEVTIQAEKWMGTADALDTHEVIDWKTARKPSVQQNILQAISLALETGRTKATLVFLKQNRKYVLFSVERGSELWEIAEQMLNITIRLFYSRVSEDVRVSKFNASAEKMIASGKKKDRKIGISGIPAVYAEIAPPPF